MCLSATIPKHRAPAAPPTLVYFGLGYKIIQFGVLAKPWRILCCRKILMGMYMKNITRNRQLNWHTSLAYINSIAKIMYAEEIETRSRAMCEKQKCRVIERITQIAIKLEDFFIALLCWLGFFCWGGVPIICGLAPSLFEG